MVSRQWPWAPCPVPALWLSWIGVFYLGTCCAEFPGLSAGEMRLASPGKRLSLMPEHFRGGGQSAFGLEWSSFPGTKVMVPCFPKADTCTEGCTLKASASFFSPWLKALVTTDKTIQLSKKSISAQTMWQNSSMPFGRHFSLIKGMKLCWVHHSSNQLPVSA